MFIRGEFDTDEGDQDRLREGDNKFWAIKMAETGRVNRLFESYVRHGAQLVLDDETQRLRDHIDRYRNQFIGEDTEDVTQVRVNISFE